MSTDTPWPTPLPSPRSDDPRQPFLRRPEVYDDAAAFAVVGAASVALSFGVGALWRTFAPAVLGTVSQGGVYYADPEGKTFIARDGWFAVFACIAAALLALAAFVRYRRGGSVGAALGLAAGGIGGGYLAAWFGAIIGPGQGSILRAVHGVANGATFQLPVTLRAVGVIWLWPAVAAGLFFFLTLLFGPSDPQMEQPSFPGWGAQENGAAPGLDASPFDSPPIAHARDGEGNGVTPADAGRAPIDSAGARDDQRTARPDQRPE